MAESYPDGKKIELGKMIGEEDRRKKKLTQQDFEIFTSDATQRHQERNNPRRQGQGCWQYVGEL